MVLEIAALDIKVDELESFEEVLASAKNVISQSKGFISISFQKCLETPGKYLALIYWETLEDHTIGFRESELFKEWRAILSPYFYTPPFADHYSNIEI
jgi:heme-degrading monooxygenase HmoA